ncbi:MAG: RDD family protein [Propioniciclava sp.]
MTTTGPYPGETLGLPEAGAGSLAPWNARFGALMLDWGASMAIAVGAFGAGVLTEQGWKAWMILAVYGAQKAVLTGLTGSSFGQLVTGVGVVRTDGARIGWGAAVLRAAMICLVLPALVVGAERRGLDDLVLGTVVVRRR